MADEKYSLSYFLLLSLNKTQSSEAKVSNYVQTSLLEILCLISSIFIVLLNTNGKVPPGFISHINTAFQNTTPGKVYNEFIRWLVNLNSECEIEAINKWIKEDEKTKGWLNQSIVLRNEYYHPGTKNKEEVQIQIMNVIASIDVNPFPGLFRQNANGALFWEYEGINIDISSFIAYNSDDTISVFSGITKEGLILIHTVNSTIKKNWSTEWDSIRRRDNLLADPTPDEIRERSSRVLPSVTEIPLWWSEDLIKNPGKIFLFEPNVSLLFQEKLKEIEVQPVYIVLQNEESVPIAVGRQLGVVAPEKQNDFLNCFNQGKYCFLLDTTAIDNRDFKKIFRWCIDIIEAASKETISIIIERDDDQLLKSKDFIEDTLSGDVNKYIAIPPSAKGYSLNELVWKKVMKKPLLRNFWK